MAKLAAGGRICAGWPKAYGGQDLSVLENVVLVEEFARAAAPAEARKNGAAADPVIRQRLALAWSKIRIMEVNGRRNLSGIFDPNLSAAQQQGLAALAATNKMFWSEYHRDTMELAMDILGMAGQVLTGGCADDTILGVQGRGPRRLPRESAPVQLLLQPVGGHLGGTAEMQRNIVGERVLGLPKAPRPVGK